MIEHNQSGAGGVRRLGKGSRFRCTECGWNLPNRLALADHHRRHEESRLKILEEIEKLNENGKAKEFQTLDSKVLKNRSIDPTVIENTGPGSILSKVVDPDTVKSPPLSPVSTLDIDPGVLDLNTPLPNSVRTPTQTRALSAYRRRFICTKCNFSTRTSQALANHSKTHTRKKPTLQSDSSSSGSPLSLASTSLTCGHCGFLTSSESILREHQALVHPGEIDESGQRLKAIANFDPDTFSVMHCEFCSAGFDTRRGLSIHARSHLRQLGITVSDGSGTSIELLRRIAKERKISLSLQEPLVAESPSPSIAPKDEDMDLDEKPIPLSLLAKAAKAVPLSSSSTPSPGASPAPAHSGSPSSVVKKAPISSLLPVSSPLRSPEHKAGGMKNLTSNLSGSTTIATAKPLWAPEENDAPLNLSKCEPPKEIGCEFCGEYFENRKGLSSHARSHLRQMGITEWSVNGSPIDTLREIITRRGLPCALPLKPLKTPPPSSPGPPRSPLSVSSSPSATLLIVCDPLYVIIECTFSPGISLAMAHEVEPTRDIRCEFCGEYFENRKGLSSHARSHLRQMGITEWSVNGSPIDTLREVMHKRGVGGSSQSDQGVKKESSQGANSPSWESTGGASGSEGLGASGYQSSKFRKSPLSLQQSGSRLHKQGVGSVGPSATPSAGKFFRMSPLGKRPLSEEAQKGILFTPPLYFSDPSCELCGFFFENRKALASHARAHLRQFGVTEWCVNGSPIETLSAWMRSRPQKVLEMHRSYMQGNRTTLKKVRSGSQSLVTHFSRITQISAASRAAWSYFRPESSSSPGFLKVFEHFFVVSTDNGQLSFERRPLKHPSCPDGTERDSGPPKPPRTGTVPALVPKPPSYPLVKVVGKFYTLKCRFCEVEFHGPLSVQEDWIRHLQQHILKMNYNKSILPPKEPSEPQAPFEAAF
uniref:C2H2-type domain-containing protein n=1 Tax=Pundamilia nyererei TaxID=303518 RepID=A0A3B4EVY2_9CICH